jgi:hypothetical protein
VMVIARRGLVLGGFGGFGRWVWFVVGLMSSLRFLMVSHAARGRRSAGLTDVLVSNDIRTAHVSQEGAMLSIRIDEILGVYD